LTRPRVGEFEVATGVVNGINVIDITIGPDQPKKTKPKKDVADVLNVSAGYACVIQH